MHELTRRILETRSTGVPALLPYIMAGDGGLERTGKLLDLFEDLEVAAVEIGIPFSDPVADGPVIEAAGNRSLAAGTTLKQVLTYLKGRPPGKVCRILMSYLNPIQKLGVKAFFQLAAEASVSAVIIPDLPLEEMGLCLEESRTHGIPMIPLATPHTSPERLQELLCHTDGFIYAVTVSGITGERRALPEDLMDRLARLKELSPLPVIAGFGISTPEQAASVSRVCDGCIIGSRIVDMASKGQEAEIADFILNCRTAAI